MRVFLRRYFNKKYIALYLFLAVVFSFQNCADPLPSGAEDADSISAKADKYPFAFDTKIDTFSYMSCSGTSDSVFNNQALYTFKTGAYNAGSGVGLNGAYVAAVGNTRLSRQQTFLSEGAQNRGAQLQAALRKRHSLLEYYISSPGSGGVEGLDYDNLITPLVSDELIQPILSANGSKIGYFSNLLGLENRRVESSLYFNGNETLANDIRLRMNNGEVIYTLSYANTIGDEPLKPLTPGDPSVEAYGLGLRLLFSKGHGMDEVTGQLRTFTGEADARVVYDIREIDLLKTTIEKSTSEANWVCPAHLKFMIVRPEDNDKVWCGVPIGQNSAWLANGLFEDPDLLVSSGRVTQVEYEAVRAMLPIEYWHVDFTRQCIVPKEPEDKCYDKQVEKDINYQNEGTDTTCKIDGEEGSLQCPHYATVCYRAN